MTSATPRESYHHGDLRAALIEAGYGLARQGGSDAVRLRAVTRAAGVSAPAAYRHFASRDQLLLDVARRGMADLARSIERAQADLAAHEPMAGAAGRLRGVGLGYIAFALDEPGAFDVAMFGLMTMDNAGDAGSAGESGRTPYQLLTDSIADLVAEGALPPDRAGATAIHCWSSVHGFATLAIHGPIRMFPRPVLDVLADELVSGIVGGVVAG